MTADLFAAVAPPTCCKWCGDGEATTVIYDWPTCLGCAVSREVRVRSYQRRLERAAAQRR